MIWSMVRRARKFHQCFCGRGIREGDLYRSVVASPDHGDLGNMKWWRSAECSECCRRYGRPLEAAA